MVSRTQLSTTKTIQQRTGKTFHVATRLLPERIRHPTYVLYAFFRVADEVVDDPDAAPPDEQRAELDRIEAAALGEAETDDPVLAAFHEVKEAHGIADREVEVFLDAMANDVDTDRYETHEDLAGYLRGSAVAVGHMMTALMDPDDPAAARPHAQALGEAFQLTNFLRDVREDVVDFDRIYLPRSTLRTHGVDEATVENLTFTPEFADAMRAELARTERLYDVGVAGIDLLPADCRFAVLLSAVLYADHHRLIRERDCDVLSATPSLSMARRLRLVARTWWHYKRADSARDAFYAASVVAPPAERDDPRAAPVEPGGVDDPDPGPAVLPDGDAPDESGRRLPGRPRRLLGAPARKVARSVRSIAGGLLGGG